MAHVRAYHGTTLSNAQRIRDEGRMRVVENSYDWLGPGAYFFQEAPHKAWKWAVEKAARSINDDAGTDTDEPAVIGVDINLERCFDLLDTENWRFVQDAHQILNSANGLKDQRSPLLTRWNGVRNHLFSPEPVTARAGANFTDNSVVKYLMQTIRARTSSRATMVRAAFVEGCELYENSYFFDEYHVQICVFGEHEDDILIGGSQNDLSNLDIYTSDLFSA